MTTYFKDKLYSENELDKTLILWGEKKLTYNDLLTSYESVSLENIKSGDVVALIGDYNPVSIAYLFRLIDENCIVVPITNDTRNQHDYFFENAEVDWIIDNGIISKNSKSKKQKNILIDNLKELSSPGLILFSSGTSGKPKSILHNLDTFFERYTNTSKVMTTLSFLLFDHIGGLNTFFYSFFAGSKIVFPESRDPNYIWNLIQEQQIELLPTSPTFLRLSKASVDFNKINLEKLKLITYGTELMEESLLHWFIDLLPSVDFRQTYGLSELGILRIKGESKDSLFITIGGETQFKIIEKVLHIKAENPMLGYLNSENPFDEEGFYNTKDIVEEKGNFFKILARETDLINIGGQKINPLDLETFLLSLDEIKDASVYGVPNKILGNTLKLDIELNLGITLEKKVINKIILDKFPPIFRPSSINFIDSPQYNHRFKKMRNNNE